MWDIDNECELDHTKCSHIGAAGCSMHCASCVHLPELRRRHRKHNPSNHRHHAHSAAGSPDFCGPTGHPHHKGCDIHGRACPFYTQDGVPIDIHSENWPGDPPIGAMGADGQNNVYTWNGEKWILLSDTLGLDLVVTAAQLAGLSGTDAPDGSGVAIPSDDTAYNRYALDFRAGVWLKNRIKDVDEKTQEQIDRFEQWLISVWGPAASSISSLITWKNDVITPFVSTTNDRLEAIELQIGGTIFASDVAYGDITVADALDTIMPLLPTFVTRSEFELLEARVALKPDTVNRIAPVADASGILNIQLVAGDIKFTNDIAATPYDDTAGYQPGDLVIYGGNTYSALIDIAEPAGPWNPDNWRMLTTIEDEFGNVVYRIPGKGLSTNDYTDNDRAILMRAMFYIGQFTSVNAADAEINSEEMQVITLVMNDPEYRQRYISNTLGTFPTTADLPTDSPNGVFAYVTKVGPFAREGGAWVPANTDPHWIGFFDNTAALPTSLGGLDYAIAATRDSFVFYSGTGSPVNWLQIASPDLRVQNSMIIAGNLGYVFDNGAWVPVADPNSSTVHRLVFHSGGTAVITDQQVLTDAWTAAGGSMPIPDGANLVDMDNDFFVYAFFTSTGEWAARGADHVGIFGENVPGMIIGSPTTDNGRVIARSDGTGEVRGWAEMQTNIEVLRTGKQDVLIAGENITIGPDGRTISSSGGGGVLYDELGYNTDGAPTQRLVTTLFRDLWDAICPGYEPDDPSFVPFGITFTYVEGTPFGTWQGDLMVRTSETGSWELPDMNEGQALLAASAMSTVLPGSEARVVLESGKLKVRVSQVTEPDPHTTLLPGFVIPPAPYVPESLYRVNFGTIEPPGPYIGQIQFLQSDGTWTDLRETGSPTDVPPFSPSTITDAFNANPEYNATSQYQMTATTEESMAFTVWVEVTTPIAPANTTVSLPLLSVEPSSTTSKYRISRDGVPPGANVPLSINPIASTGWLQVYNGTWNWYEEPQFLADTKLQNALSSLFMPSPVYVNPEVRTNTITTSSANMMFWITNMPGTDEIYLPAF